jgi:ribose 5-phosphate isomerase B
MKIAIGSDHAGFEMKEVIIKYLSNNKIDIIDKGTYSEERADYPDFGHAVAKAIEEKEAELGILICGSGNGINMAANKHAHIRSALCWNEEIASLARQHNNANILALPGRFISKQEGEKIVEAFLSAQFEGGRHADRVNKIPC